ncbi:sugar ABC transporter permease [Paractinoplanes ferrugineus]|uniref:ABC transporter permease n=1 Tax=Paractinoplanes ferrugineus TaxID=113564 RepID=A0A919MDR0_9ACTN|nr:sugar ABC transporter permease [Actinoplanes ferrugineus]GIE10849.1 ABC transporter permease [Actinoplanes ferrugineus]
MAVQTTTNAASPVTGEAATPRASARRHGIGWLFILPFLVVFLAFLVAPLAYAGYLSLWTKGLATGTTFAGLDNYTRAFHDPSFRKGLWFVLRFSLVVIPLQVLVALVAALLLDEITGRLARFARLTIFLPYAIPAVLGALMWGFLYSPSFGPIEQISSFLNVQAPFLLSRGNVFYGLLNVVTWQWSGYYMIIIYAALKGIDSSIYEAARIDGASGRQIALRVKVPLVRSALVLILVFSLIGTLQFFVEPQILRPIANGTITPDFTPNIYAYEMAFNYAQFNYASAISFALGFVVFAAVAVFMFATRKRGSLFT